MDNRTEFTKMINVLFKHSKINASYIDDVVSLIKICIELGFTIDETRTMFPYKDIKDNFLYVQHYHMNKVINNNNQPFKKKFMIEFDNGVSFELVKGKGKRCV